MPTSVCLLCRAPVRRRRRSGTNQGSPWSTNHWSASGPAPGAIGCVVMRVPAAHGCGTTSSAIVSISSSTPSNLHHPPDPGDEGDLDQLVVEVEVGAVEHVGLHPALALPVEGRVGADADRRGQRLAAGACPRSADSSSTVSQPAYTPSAGAASPRVGHVGRRVAELATPLLAAGHAADHGERPPERLGRTLDVAAGQAGAHVRRGPDLRSTVERDPLDPEVLRPAGLGQHGHVAGGLRAEPEVGRPRPRRRRAARRRARGRRTPPGSRRRSRARTGSRRRRRRRPRRAAGTAGRCRSGPAVRARGGAPRSGAGRRSPPRRAGPRRRRSRARGVST